VTDAGLVHFKVFTNLTDIDLSELMTDDGLKHLYGFTKLKRVKVGPKVTDAGIKQLQEAIPGCNVVR
jgi:hypothetical protein